MRNLTRFAALALAAAAVAWAAAPAARADVVIQQQTTFDVAFIKAHGTSTQSTSPDKQRNDSALQCEGFMSMLCGNTQSADIVRLDKDLRWTLDLKKQEYREAPFPTAAQRQAASKRRGDDGEDAAMPGDPHQHRGRARHLEVPDVAAGSM